MYTYKIHGTVNCNDAETYSGNKTVEITDYIDVADLSCESALRTFFADNSQYDDFYRLSTCDAETYGKQYARFVDSTDSAHTISVSLVK